MTDPLQGLLLLSVHRLRDVFCLSACDQFGVSQHRKVSPLRSVTHFKVYIATTLEHPSVCYQDKWPLDIATSSREPRGDGDFAHQAVLTRIPSISLPYLPGFPLLPVWNNKAVRKWGKLRKDGLTQIIITECFHEKIQQY